MAKTDLSKIDPNAEIITLGMLDSLEGNVDLTRFKEIRFESVDLSNVTEIKFNPNAEYIHLSGCIGLKGKLDFSGVKALELAGVDLSNVTEIKFNPNAELINLGYTKGLKGKFDFSGVEFLRLPGADLSQVTEIKFNPHAVATDLSNCKIGFEFSGLRKRGPFIVGISNIDKLKNKVKKATKIVVNKIKSKPKSNIVSKGRGTR